MAGSNGSRSLRVVKSWRRSRVRSDPAGGGGGRGPQVVAQRRARGEHRTGRHHPRSATASVRADDDELEFALVERPARPLAAPRPVVLVRIHRRRNAFHRCVIVLRGAADIVGRAQRTASGRLVVGRPARGRPALSDRRLGAVAGNSRRESVRTWRRWPFSSPDRLSTSILCCPFPLPWFVSVPRRSVRPRSNRRSRAVLMQALADRGCGQLPHRTGGGASSTATFTPRGVSVE